jgi:hypothetical protein
MKHELSRFLRRNVVCWLVLAGVALVPSQSFAHLQWRVSVKIILDASGQRPTATNQYNFSTPARIREEFTAYNQLLDRAGWGYQIDLTEVVELSGVSQWFSVGARSGSNRTDLEVQAKLHPVQYAYRANAINVYVNNDSSGVAGPDLPLLGDVILAGARGYWTLLLHEIGHELGLCHTHGCLCNDNCFNVSDNIVDTITDSDQWISMNAVAQGNFSLPYASLSAAQRRLVDDLWQNIMSYHEHDQTNLVTRFTHDQWELMVDVSNVEKRNVTSGSTVFVDKAATGMSPCELINNLASLVDGLPGPVAWYQDELNSHLPGPEYYLRRTCRTFTIDPPTPPRPPLVPADWPWPPPLNLGKPPGYPGDWPWPLINPEPFTVCLGGAYKTVQAAIDCAANPGDRLQIKAGHYNERLTITKQLTLATDRGSVVIGAP